MVSNRNGLLALFLAASLAMTRPDHAAFKRAFKKAAKERSGLGWAGGLLSSLSTFVAGRMFVHRDCFFFTIEHASVGHDKHEIVFLGIFNTWIAFEKGPPGKVYFL